MRGFRTLALALVLLSAACASGQSWAAQAQERATQPVFVITYSPGLAWRAGVPMNRQALGPHAAYWTRLAREGRAIAAGPYLDVDGGMAMINAANIDEVRAIVAADP